MSRLAGVSLLPLFVHNNVELETANAGHYQPAHEEPLIGCGDVTGVIWNQLMSRCDPHPPRWLRGLAVGPFQKLLLTASRWWEELCSAGAHAGSCMAASKVAYLCPGQMKEGLL